MTAAGAALVVAAAVAWLLLAARATLVAARMLQIEEYEQRRLLAWGRQRAWLAHPAAASGVLCVAATIVANLWVDGAVVVVGAAWLAASLAGHALWRWVAVKRELAFTARMRRLLAAAFTLLLAATAAACAGTMLVPRTTSPFVAVLALGVTGVPLVVLAAANALLRPVESAVRARYLRRAREKLAAVHPFVVAVAGSYGKTSTKHILAHLLGGEDVLPTRKSFNTLMGVTRVVNEDLDSAHRIFIVEMDAYSRGEIASICELVHPRVAMLTAVGPQHLERFGTMAAVGAALYESVEGLPSDGTAVIHVGDEGGRALAERARAQRRSVIGYALASDAADADVQAGDVRTGSGGTTFTWRWPARGLECAVSTPLLGRLQALNITAALIAVALLERPLPAAVEAAHTLRPVEHRLQVLDGGGPVTVIDDSYNANPVGVHEGLEVLAGFDARSRILVTPGLVELGSVEESENRRYGEHAAKVCDHVVVAEARPAAALIAGLRAGGMPADRIHSVRDLRETRTLLARLAQSGDVVLFANDLPDTYLPGPRGRAAGTKRGPGG